MNILAMFLPNLGGNVSYGFTSITSDGIHVDISIVRIQRDGLIDFQCDFSTLVAHFHYGKLRVYLHEFVHKILRSLFIYMKETLTLSQWVTHYCVVGTMLIV